jgi:hypothetical protein
MDFAHTIRDLRAELHRVEAAIAALEGLSQSAPQPVAPRKRGRKSMGTEERKQVSERLRLYWAARREARQPSARS